MATGTREKTANGGEQKEEVQAAGKELARSLWRTWVSIASAPVRLLPDETQNHLRAAGREAVRAGVALNRGLLEASERRLEEIEQRLDEDEMEEEVSEAD